MKQNVEEKNCELKRDNQKKKNKRELDVDQTTLNGLVEASDKSSKAAKVEYQEIKTKVYP